MRSAARIRAGSAPCSQDKVGAEGLFRILSEQDRADGSGRSSGFISRKSFRMHVQKPEHGIDLRSRLIFG